MGNYSVYIRVERGAPHHRPHAHVYLGRALVASVYLETLTVYDNHERLPSDVLKRIREQQDDLLELWMELNPDE
jgi:hypothetical protein